MSVQLDTTKVVLVDNDGRRVGVADKLDAHQAPGKLHSAFSVFVFDSLGRILLQQRAATKYHFGGLWTNTCCSHPAPDEDVLDASVRRMREELHMEIDAPRVVGRFRYRATDPVSGLVEHELDHVIVARAMSEPVMNPAEVDDIRWLAPAAIRCGLAERPHDFTPWFAQAFAIAAATLDPTSADAQSELDERVRR